MVIWLWIGGGVMAFGTILVAFPGKRRRPIDPVSVDRRPDPKTTRRPAGRSRTMRCAEVIPMPSRQEQA